MTDVAPAGCPKDMTWGPCGGVRPDLVCEVGDRPCPFVAGRPSAASVPSPEHPTHRARPVSLPPVLVDVRYPRNAPPASRSSIERWWTRVAGVLHGCGALLGEHVDNPPARADATPLDAVDAVELLTGAGVVTVATVTGRDRRRADAAARMARLAGAGASAIHCVTGDHPAVLGLTEPAWFGAESLTLLDDAAGVGVAATVGESPLAPGDRVDRLAAKQRAGAGLAVLNHSGDPAAVVDFASRCRAAGVRLPFVAPVPMVADAATALALEAFPGLHLPDGLLASVARAGDPLAVGLRWAVDLTAELARSGVVDGINLSGGTTAPDAEERLSLTKEFVPAVRAAWETVRGAPAVPPEGRATRSTGQGD